MITALNLCELPVDNLGLDFITKISNQICAKRIYIGSNFCSQYFIRLSGYKKIFEYCSDKNLPITLSVPVISEKDLEAGKNKIRKLLDESNGLIDEITVNDIGMFAYLNGFGIKINLGRLMFKIVRDGRVPDIGKSSFCNYFTYPFNLDRCPANIRGLELDPVRDNIDLSEINNKGLLVSAHVPYCYATTGNLCEFASIHKDTSMKFRPNMSCQRECSYVFQIYPGHNVKTDTDTEYIRLGRTLYYKQECTRIVRGNVDRIIYFPADEIIQYMKGGSV